MITDEHTDPHVAAALRDLGFRTIEACRDNKYKDREELDYLPELYRQNGIFVTSDLKFCETITTVRPRHAGVVFIPTGMDVADKTEFASIVRAYVQGATSRSRFALRNHVMYPDHDGLHDIANGKDELVISWPRLFSAVQL